VFFIPRSAFRTPNSNALRVENRLHGYIVVHQQLSRKQTGNRPATFQQALSGVFKPIFHPRNSAVRIRRSADWQSAVSPVGLARRSVLAKAGNRRSERNRTNPDGFLMERGIHSASPPLGTTNLGLSDDKRRNPTFALIPHSALVQISCTFDFKLSTLIIEPAPKPRASLQNVKEQHLSKWCRLPPRPRSFAQANRQRYSYPRHPGVATYFCFFITKSFVTLGRCNAEMLKRRAAFPLRSRL